MFQKDKLPQNTPQATSITRAVDELVNRVLDVNTTNGKDARKARLLVKSVAHLLVKLGNNDPAVRIYVKKLFPEKRNHAVQT